ncbi:MAG TPA: hypothetical protein VGC20_17850 [bacterium]|jgi:hypothetical protein
MARKKGWDPNRKSGRKREAHFMDVALDGYVRDLALRRWREFEDLSEVYDHDVERALEEAGAFPAASSYRPLWQESWQRHVWPGPEEKTGPLFGRIEAAVREALLRERELRLERGEPTIEDTPGYQEFVGRALGRLLEEASGEIEELD